MTRKETNLGVFRRKPISHVFFQPRFEPWFAWHCQSGNLPEELKGLSLRQAYDLIGASMRSVHYYTEQPDPITRKFDSNVKVSEKSLGNQILRGYETPFGQLTETLELTPNKTWWVTEFAAKSVGDFPALKWLLQHRVIAFSRAHFLRGANYIGDRGEPQFWVPKSPYMSLAQEWMKYEDFIYALNDYPQRVQDIMSVIDESYDLLYEQLVTSDFLHILNFGENIATAYLTPKYFEKYLIPWYEKRAGQLRRSGIFTHIHIDGNFRFLLPYLADLPFDGLEALTPKPQGDVTIEEIHEFIGDKILLDGIPAILFMEHYSRKTLQSCVVKIVKLFHPRLVLGISDELPGAGGQESFDRLKWIANWCRTGDWQ